MICWLVRHGQDDQTIRGGWSSHGLTTAGILQVHSLSKDISDMKLRITRLYSSDLRRARETALILAEPLNLEVKWKPEFRETNNGELSGMKHQEAELLYPGLYWSTLAYDECYPNGESPKLFFDRVKTAWLAFKSEACRHPEENWLLVTHGGVIEAILCIENNVKFSNKQKHFSTPNAKLIPVEI